jgi:predicted small metal-binding protein
MGKLYRISCRDAGVDCDFQAEGVTIEEVMQACADHGMQEHGMKGFGPELYSKMRNCLKTIDDAEQ